MIPEPLKNKGVLDPNSTLWNFEPIFQEKDIKSAVEFYKRYRNLDYSSEGYEMLKKEKPKIYKEFIEYLKRYKICACVYNSWLFDYTFQDVI